MISIYILLSNQLWVRPSLSQLPRVIEAYHTMEAPEYLTNCLWNPKNCHLSLHSTVPSIHGSSHCAIFTHFYTCSLVAFKPRSLIVNVLCLVGYSWLRLLDASKLFLLPNVLIVYATQVPLFLASWLILTSFQYQLAFLLAIWQSSSLAWARGWVFWHIVSQTFLHLPSFVFVQFSGPRVEWIDNCRPIFKVLTRLVSTVNTQDQPLQHFFWVCDNTNPSQPAHDVELCRAIKVR